MTFDQWLCEKGWKHGLQRFDTCRVCGSYGDYFGWRSPKFAFYHNECLMKSSRGQRLHKQYEKDMQDRMQT